MVIFTMLIGVAGVSAQGGEVVFFSTQFNVVEEAEKFRAILDDFDAGDAVFKESEEQTVYDTLSAEKEQDAGSADVVGALHGTFPTLVKDDVLFDLTGLLEQVEMEYDIADAFVELGKMGTADFQYYIPWMQATYIMAANVEALEYLPEGADINALTWDELALWGKNIYDATGEARIGFPVDGLWHRFMQGYAFPSFTGGMVTKFKSPEAVAMFEFLRDDLWPYVHPQSITYSFMQEPLLNGEVWVAFDHTARLLEAFNQEPDNFVAFPAPAGPAGRGFMPVVVGLGVPANAPNPEGAVALIQYLLMPETQGAVLKDLGFFPVVAGVDTSDLPEGIAIEQAAVAAQASAMDALPALLPVGLGERGGEFSQLYKDAVNRILLNGEDIQTVLDEEAALLQALLDDTGAPCWPPDAASDGACQIE
ncbi:MAG: carbohydrate ABC transporter substrate-binding protein [Anaerolineae bacterium]|nr:carbohydrate ABC transporter substrate-binding protein [Anaerolineae bacterium]